MKNNQFSRILLFLLLISGLNACISDADFEIPTALGSEENIRLEELKNQILSGSTSEIDISSLKSLFVRGEAIEITSDLVLRGFVSSSDQSGNFYKELFIQDKFENPSTGIRIALEFTNSYNRYNLGREIYINLKGLYLGESRIGDGLISIGGSKNSDNEIQNISLNQMEYQVLRSERTENLVPLPLPINQINSNHVGIYIQALEVQFPSDLEGKTYYNPNDAFDTQHRLESCMGFTYTNFLLETSSFANFRFTVIPMGGGTISGVISKTYTGSNLVLVLNSLSDVHLTEERCNPLDINQFDILFEENFDDGKDNSKFDFPGWLNVAEEGDEFWTEQLFGSNGYAEFSGFRTNDPVNIGWLIAPKFTKSLNELVYLNFQNGQHHVESIQNSLQLFISTDFNGSNFSAANWQELSANLAYFNDTWYVFKDSGLIDLSGFSGDYYIAFRYQGSGTDLALDGAYMIDNFRILKPK